MYDVNEIRKDFPILSRQVNGKPLVYLDNGASAQKPKVVIDAVIKAYSEEYANVHRGLHFLSNLATEKYESVRGIVAKFLNAADEDEIIFNSGTTEGINMVAYAWAAPRLQARQFIIDRGFDLFAYRPVACPSSGHVLSPSLVPRRNQSLCPTSSTRSIIAWVPRENSSGQA